jgi:hypothetical protein
MAAQPDRQPYSQRGQYASAGGQELLAKPLKRIFLQAPSRYDLRLDDHRGYTWFDYQYVWLLCAALDATDIFRPDDVLCTP